MSFPHFVNHHGQSILLGYILISRENTDFFIWLFKIWFSYMSSHAPSGIITNQDKRDWSCFFLYMNMIILFTQHTYYFHHTIYMLLSSIINFNSYQMINNWPIFFSKKKMAIYVVHLCGYELSNYEAITFNKTLGHLSRKTSCSP